MADETTKDIVADLRARAGRQEAAVGFPTVESGNDRRLADRIEAAAEPPSNIDDILRDMRAKEMELWGRKPPRMEQAHRDERGRGMNTPNASPRPWRVADIDHDYDILDAEGKVSARAAHGDRGLAALICDAVNLKARIDAAMADESGYLHPVALDGKPMVCVTPPPSEREEIRMHREYETSLIGDRERFRRGFYEAAERNDRLRDLVRRLLPSLRRDIAQCNGPRQAPALAALLEEARAAIGEGGDHANAKA